MKAYVVPFSLLLLFLLSCEKGENPERTYESYIEDILSCMNMQRPVDSYNYPVLPGMDAWKEFQTTLEMIEACQIPIDILDKMSAEAVFQALWEYPFFFEITFRAGYYQKDFETVFGENNAYYVLLERNEATEVIYNRLRLVEPSCSEACGVYSRGLELFMSQSVFLDQLSYEHKQDVVSISLKNDRLRQEAIGYEPDVSREVTMLLISRTLYSANYEPFINELDDNMMSFISTSAIQVYTKEEYDTFLQTIISNAQEFINQTN